ncbi:uncharacterized protein BO96DRAFT_438332 [Aspergillus niger CBS 101883]|uniref:Uncharacterized protein n=2 Tax=Aspergillus niger TaxID=5061 RepID=A2QAD0_ASPNC|nr:uncharacterized protein BO96DRAFT_438332 [Aspergillus niger CBS 101883]XP_059599785.1 hypothetical protein An01g11020 [Aspergillus niger]PYH52045.1 hypothetical protein BO96DRAFT_438332 [Aspergillus niger CBS 101883]CAK37282.1 hypothetical protein An01g11020 [Aspergillus niger]
MDGFARFLNHILMEESQGLEPCRTGGVLVVLDKKRGKQGSGDQRGAGFGFAQQDAHPEARLPQPFIRQTPGISQASRELGKAEQTNKLEVASTTSLHHPLHPLASSEIEPEALGCSDPLSECVCLSLMD